MMRNTICNPVFVHAAPAVFKSKPIVDFTRSGWRKLEKVNRALGAHFIRPIVLREELAEYIAAHEQSGRHFDTEGTDIRYDDGVYVIRCSRTAWRSIGTAKQARWSTPIPPRRAMRSS